MLSSEEFCQALSEAGVLPDLDTVTRLVIDAQPRHPLVIHVQRRGDGQWLTAAGVLAGHQVERQGPPAGPSYYELGERHP